MSAGRRGLLGAAALAGAARPAGATPRLPAEAGPVYALIEAEVHDLAAFAEYVRGHMAGLREAGGRFLVAGGAFDVVEGGRNPKRLIVQHWPTAGAFYAWYDGEDYARWRLLRWGAARTDVVLVQGVAG